MLPFIIGGAALAVIAIIVIIVLATGSSISSSGGRTRINNATEITFRPNRTGLWEFETSNNGSHDPYLEILDERGNRIAYDDDSGTGYNAWLVVPLEARTRYTIVARFYDGTRGSYDLTVRYYGNLW